MAAAAWTSVSKQWAEGVAAPLGEVHSPSNIASMKTFFGSLLAVNAFTLLFTLATVRHGLQYIIPALLCTAGG